MKYKMYQVDAFAEKLFEGNPAAVIPLTSWLPDQTMQSIAAENNLSETVYYIPTEEGYHIRWFTPNKEVKLCGHATLAAAYVIFNCLDNHQGTNCDPNRQDHVVFESLSGKLMVVQRGDLLTLDFPLDLVVECQAMPEVLSKGLGIEPLRCFKGHEDYLVQCERAEQVEVIEPNYNLLASVECRAIIVTAPSDRYDFVCRVFAPRYGIPEDPVTGSAYTLLAPFWSAELGKKALKARQLSPRGGNVHCRVEGDRVFISGRAVKFFEGVIDLSTVNG